MSAASPQAASPAPPTYWMWEATRSLREIAWSDEDIDPRLRDLAAATLYAIAVIDPAFMLAHRGMELREFVEQQTNPNADPTVQSAIDALGSGPIDVRRTI